MNEKDQLLKMIEVQREQNILTESEYQRMYHRITGKYVLGLEDAKRFEMGMVTALGSINNLAGLGLITKRKAAYLEEKGTIKIMKLASEGKLDDEGKTKEA
tara:strand:+ start:23228 stop:23530 length:303 start_codon:yes stop_codon:yes gene_type:complete